MKKGLTKILSTMMMLIVLVCALSFPAEAATSTKVFKTNVSSSEATCNATDGGLPAALTTVNGGSSYYFNFAVSEDIHIVKAVLYVKTVGSSSFTKAKTITPSKSYIRYGSYKYTFDNTAGTFSYKWQITYYLTSSSKTYTKTTSTASLTVKKASSSTFPTSLYLTQAGSTTCTLASATMMIRARFYLSDSSYWSKITESKVKSYGWLSGTGLYHTFTYKYNSSNKVTVSSKSYSGVSLSKIKSYLEDHPEGIVLYTGKHAVFITRVSGSTIYCADPLSSYSGKEIKLSASYLGKYYGSQSKVLSATTRIWYISSYTIK